MFSKDALKSLKKNLVIKPLTEDDLVYPEYYISTGNYAVNKIISGSMFRGIPNNRITAFYGESGCVPFESKIYILIKNELEVADVLQHVESEEIFEHLFDEISIKDKINLLIEIGFSQAEIAKRTGLSRQIIYLYKHDVISPVKLHTGLHSVYYKINKLIQKAVYKIPLHAVKLLHYKHIKFLVLTPNGFRRCGKLIDKGEKESYVITVTDCPTTIVSKDHLVQLDNGKFEFAENIYNEHKIGFFKPKIRTVHGSRSLLNIRDGGFTRMCDLEILDDNHAYFVDDISGHNSGKSLIVSEIIINAIKENNYDHIFYLDSEGGLLPEVFQSALSEEQMEKILHVPVENIEHCTEVITQLYDSIRTQFDSANGDKNKQPRVMVVLDSYSALVPKAFTDKALKGNVVADMGGSAKAKNAMIKSLMMPVQITGCPLVIICHSYKRMDLMTPQKFDAMAGGEGIKYASHIVVQSKSAKKKQEDANLGIKGGGSYYAQNLIRYATAKDRLVKEGLEATMIIDYNKGIQKFAGLWDDAIRLGFIKQMGGWYQVPSWKEPEKKFRKDDIAENEEIWNTFLKEMDEIFKKETQYRSGNDVTLTSQTATPQTDPDFEEMENM